MLKRFTYTIIVNYIVLLVIGLLFELHFAFLPLFKLPFLLFVLLVNNLILASAWIIVDPEIFGFLLGWHYCLIKWDNFSFVGYHITLVFVCSKEKLCFRSSKHFWYSLFNVIEVVAEINWLIISNEMKQTDLWRKLPVIGSPLFRYLVLIYLYLVIPL